jgi:hypothetical protein
MPKFFRWLAKQVILIIILTFVSLAIEAVLNNEDADKLTQVQDQMKATLQSMAPASVWNRYFYFATTHPVDTCERDMSVEDCFPYPGAAAQWVGRRITWPYIRFLAVAIAAFADLTWATFWLPGLVPKTIGLIQLAAGTAFAIWFFMSAFGDDSPESRMTRSPFNLVTVAGFCLCAVAAASALAWIIYGFGTVVEWVVGAIAQLGRLAATTASYLWLVLRFLGVGIEHTMDEAIERLFARVAALFKRAV